MSILHRRRSLAALRKKAGAIRDIKVVEEKGMIESKITH